MVITMQTTIVIIHISDDVHAVVAAQHGRRIAALYGFDLVDQTAISTAILEITRNIVKYARCGEITIEILPGDGEPIIEVVAHDDGPGIPDIALAMQNGYSTGETLGLGLPGARRLMSEFEIESSPESGTTIIMRKRKST